MRTIGVLLMIVALFVALSLMQALPAMANQNVPAGFTDTPTPTEEPEPTVEPTPPPAVVPEASTLVLLGSSAAGLAAYVGLQIRARRRS